MEEEAGFQERDTREKEETKSPGGYPGPNLMNGNLYVLYCRREGRSAQAKDEVIYVKGSAYTRKFDLAAFFNLQKAYDTTWKRGVLR